jgi:uncharacterized protein
MRDPKIVKSNLSRTVKRDGVTVEVWIFRLDHETEWLLEVVNSAGSSIIWSERFASDAEAYIGFERTVAEEGIRTFLEEENEIVNGATGGSSWRSEALGRRDVQ